MNLFGRAKAQKAVEAPPQVDVVAHISKLQEQIGQIEKQIAHCDTQIKSFTAQALERRKRNDTNGARLFMKRILRQQEQQKKFLVWIDNLESQQAMLQSQSQNAAYIKTMGASTTVMKSMTAAMSPEAVDKLREEHDEAVADFEEIDSMLKESWTHDTSNEADLDAALDALSAGAMEESMGVPAVAVPAVAAPAPSVAADTHPVAPLPAMVDAPIGPISVPAAARPAAAAPASVMDALAALDAAL